MEEKRLLVKSVYAQDIIKQHLVFDYKCIENTNNGKKTTLVFQRDDTTPYYNELVALEKKYKEYKGFPFIFIALLPLISLVLLTVFVVLLAINNFNVDMTLFVALMVPAILILMLTAILSALHIFKLKKVQEEKEKQLVEFDKIVQELKTKH